MTVRICSCDRRRSEFSFVSSRLLRQEGREILAVKTTPALCATPPKEGNFDQGDR